MNAQRDDLLERALAALDRDKELIREYREECARLRAENARLHRTRDEARGELRGDNDHEDGAA